jgi:aminotransferase
MKYTIIAFVYDKPGVLNRLSDLFTRRKINIESLTVSTTEQQGVARFTILVEADRETIEKVVKQIYKVIEVIKVFETTDQDLIYKEIAFIKVTAKTPDQRMSIERAAALFRARIVHVAYDYLVIEITGSEDETQSLEQLLKPYGIKEFVKSGRIAVLKDENRAIGKMSSHLKEPSHSIQAIELSAIKKLELMARNQGDVVSLAQGIPSFATPKNITKAAEKAIGEGLCDKYSVGYGIEPLRVAITKKLRRDNNIDAKPSQVIVTHGAIEAMMAAFVTILNKEDEVIFLTPDYASHITQSVIAHYGAHPVFVSLDEKNGWSFNPEKLEAAITQRTKAILICNPSNPIGKVYTREELEQVAAIAKKFNLYIFSDETYEYYTFDGTKHISIASLKDAADRTISVFSLSKTYSMTGWRIGYAVTSESLSKQILKVHDSLVTCATVVSQYAALEAITGPQKCVQEFKSIFEKRRKMTVDALKSCKQVSLVIPQGGYFAFVKINAPIDDYEFAVRMLKDGKVAAVPGSAFGLGGEGHLRISFGCEDVQLKEGLKRFTSFIHNNVK